jgi:hypothetical protein
MCKHGEVTREELAEAMQRVQGSEGLVVFRHEPFILHVQVCKLHDPCSNIMQTLDIALRFCYARQCSFDCSCATCLHLPPVRDVPF